MLGCVLARRSIAATDVPALGAAPQVQPPAAARQALDAAIATWFYRGIDSPSVSVAFLHGVWPFRVPPTLILRHLLSMRPRAFRERLEARSFRILRTREGSTMIKKWLPAAALMATLVNMPVLGAPLSFVFTAIPDQDETRIVERFDRFAKYLEPKLGVPVKYVPVKSYPGR